MLELNSSEARPAHGMIFSRLSRSAVLILGLLSLAGLGFTLFMPLARDQGIFAWIGATIARGGHQYTDAWDVKGPLVGLVYALELELFGLTEQGLRMADAILWLVFGATSWRACGHLQLGHTARWFAAVMAPMAVTMNWVVMGQPETWVGMLTMGLFVILTGRLTAFAIAIAAAIAGVCFTVKPVYGLLLLPVGVAMWRAARSHSDKEPLRALMPHALAAMLGFGAPILAMLLYLWSGHALQAYIDVQTRFNSEVHWLTMNKSASDVLRLFAMDFLSPRTLPRAVLTVIGSAMVLRRDQAKGWVMVSILASLYASGAVQMKWYPYHFSAFDMLTLLPIAACFDSAASSAWVSPKRSHVRGLICVVALIAWTLSKAIPTSLTTWRNITASGLTHAQNAWRVDACVHDYCHQDVVDAAYVIRANTRQEDQIFVFGFDALVYFLADRASVTGFGMSYPLLFPQIGYSADARKSVEQAIFAHPPAIIALQRRDANTLYPRDSIDYFRDYVALKSFTDKHYTELYQNDRFVLLKRAQNWK